jgi:hypothetical protein
LLNQEVVVGPAVNLIGRFLLDAFSMLQVVGLVVVVGAHLVNTVDAVPDCSVEVAPLVLGEAGVCVASDARHEVGPSSGE